MSLVVQADGNLTRVILDRPEKSNAPTRVALRRLTETIREAGDGALLICANGRNFCGGADIDDATSDPEDGKAALLETLQALAATPRPVVAAVQGTAAGAGWMIAALADLCLATEDACFVMPEVRLGLTSSVALEIFRHKAPSLPLARVLLACEKLTAAELARSGVVTAVAGGPEGLSAQADQRARELAHLPANAYSHVKRAMNERLIAALKPTALQQAV